MDDVGGTFSTGITSPAHKRDGPKTFTHGRAERAAKRIEKEMENLRDQNAPASVLVMLEATIISLLEFEQRNRPVNHEQLAADVLAGIRASRG